VITYVNYNNSWKISPDLLGVSKVMLEALLLYNFQSRYNFQAGFIELDYEPSGGMASPW
jgi:hypothetical protein